MNNQNVSETKQNVSETNSSISETSPSSVQEGSETTPLQVDQQAASAPAVSSILNERNNAMTENAALRAVLEAHGINHNIDQAMLSSLQVVDGKVQGQYNYQAPTIEATNTAGANRNVSPPGLTRDDIASMTPQQINDNWTAVSAAMKG